MAVELMSTRVAIVKIISADTRSLALRDDASFANTVGFAHNLGHDKRKTFRSGATVRLIAPLHRPKLFVLAPRDGLRHSNYHGCSVVYIHVCGN